MPPTQLPIEPGLPTPETESTESTPEQVLPGAPLSFVPHTATGETAPITHRIRNVRYDEMDKRELIKLLDLIEDERARGRFRESMYLSTFICIALAWLWFYGPRVLWHAPRLINPAEAIQQQELTQLNLPKLQPHVAKAAPQPLNKQTIKQLQTMTKNTPPAPTPAPQPQTVAPQTPPTQTATNNPPSRPSPQPPLPTAPQPRTPVSSAVPDAPSPQPSAHPNFATPDNSLSGRNLAGTRPGSSGGVRGDSHGGPLDDGAQILSDTQGVDFDPYLRRILADIKRNWEPLLPEETKPPISKQGETYVRFIILPDGSLQVGGMHLDGSTHDQAIDRSCWSAITSEGQFPPLPAQFHGPNLELRIHFLVNKGLGQ